MTLEAIGKSLDTKLIGYGSGDGNEVNGTKFLELFKNGKIVTGAVPTDNSGSAFGWGFAGSSSATGASVN